MGWIASLRRTARGLKADTLALWFCVRHPRTPVAAKVLGALVVAYALSPVDLIPDFIPVLGYLDDVILVPLGIFLTLRMVPDDVLAECRTRAQAWFDAGRTRPRSYAAAAVIVALWAFAAWLVWGWVEPLLG
jgi:uncharacterized membrane protein YkvA (DUF1232 family)